MDKIKVPVLVGIGQSAVRNKAPLDPLLMMAEVSRDACRYAALDDLKKSTSF